MKTILYNQKGEKTDEIELSKEIFNIPLNVDLLHQVVLYYERLSRKPIAKTKDRSEVRGGGRKPWRQKGTGRSRHGSIRSPIWKGGGVTFGPVPERKYQITVPRKSRKKTLFMALSWKLRDGKIIFVDKIRILGPKTKKIIEILKNLTKVKRDINKKRTVLVLAKKNENLSKAARNIQKISLVGVHSLNPYILLRNEYLVIEKEAINKIRKIN